MNIEWDKRALQQHRQRGHVKRVTARLTDTHISDIVIGVPVLTDRQVGQLTRLRDELREVAAILDAQLDVLDSALDLLRPFGHPDGWANVRIVGHEHGDIIVADIRHHAGTKRHERESKQATISRWERMSHGYSVKRAPRRTR